MAIRPNTTTPLGVRHSPQNIFNWSFDDEFGLLMLELAAYDSTTDSMRRVTTDALNHFGTNEVDKNANGSVYEGLEDANGNWQVVKITTTGLVTSNRFATVKNNPTVTTYADAWAARTSTLVYETYGEAF